MKRLKTEPEKELTKAELEVMQILWKLKKAFVGDILDRMVEPKPAYNTVSTVVRLLEKKGVVGHESFGKSHRYYPLVDKETYADSYVRRGMGNFFAGQAPEEEETIRVLPSNRTGEDPGLAAPEDPGPQGCRLRPDAPRAAAEGRPPHLPAQRPRRALRAACAAVRPLRRRGH